MAVRVAINGFGRIGRMVMRILAQRGGFNVVAINDLDDPKGLAHLLKYDSAHGKFDKSVSVEGDVMTVNGDPIKVLKEKVPANLPWKAMNIDLVIECSGVFNDKESPKGGFGDHLKAGAKRVIISAPAKGEDITVVMGVNDSKLTKEHLTISNASCTTNCLAPMALILDEAFGIVNGTMNTIHAYTNDQRIADQIHKDLRRARAAAINIIPSSTGAAKAIGLVLPHLAGKLDGFSLRVPVITGSVTDFTVNLKKEVTPEEVNAAVKTAAGSKLKGILEYSEEPLVSSDIIDNPHSCIFDALSTLVSPKGKGTTVKVLGWYDNEWGYSQRTVDLAAKVAGMM
jgi:glyceraldehyde 3-phosphate dehydrogenase